MTGFTLVELMMSVTVILIISGIAVSSYLNFNVNQAIGNDSRGLVAILDKAKTSAASQQYPSGCVSLRGVNVKSTLIDSDLKGVTVTTICDPANIVGPVEEVLTSSLFTGPFDITFLPGSGYLQGGADAVIVIRSTARETTVKTINVGAYGIVSVQ